MFWGDKSDDTLHRQIADLERQIKNHEKELADAQHTIDTYHAAVRNAQRRLINKPKQFANASAGLTKRYQHAIKVARRERIAIGKLRGQVNTLRKRL